MSEVLIALHEARDEFPAIYKNKDNPFFSARYATLGHILEAVEPVLRDKGLAIFQAVENEKLVTRIIHLESGDSWTSLYPLPQVENPQKVGSAITYARRYALSAMLGLAVEKDDDGNAAAGNGPEIEEEPVLPGWTSARQSATEHSKLSDRVTRLDDVARKACSDFRKANANPDGSTWPLPYEVFAQLRTLVDTIEAGATPVVEDEF